METRIQYMFGDPILVINNAYSQADGQGTLFILPDAVALSQVRELVLEKNGAVDSSLFMTFEELSSRIVEEEKGLRPVVLPHYLVRLISEDIVEGLAGSPVKFKLDTAFSDTLLGEFESIWPSILCSGRAARELLEGVQELSSSEVLRTAVLGEYAQSYESRMKSLSECGFYDRHLLSFEASSHASCLKNRGIRRIFVAGMVFADSVLLKLIRSIASVIDVTIIFDPSDLGRHSVESMIRSLSAERIAQDEPVPSGGRYLIFGAPDRRREIREVARRIIEEMEDHGVRQSEVAVVARSIAEYEDEIAEIFPEYSLRVDGGGRKRYGTLRLCSFLLLALDLADGELTKKKVMKLMGHDFFPVSIESLRKIEVSIAHLPEELPLEEGIRELASIQLQGGTVLSEWLDDIRKVSTGGKTLEEWTGFALRLLEMAHPVLLSDEEYNAGSKLVEGIGRFSSLSYAAEAVFGGRKVSLHQFVEMVREFASSGSYEDGTESADSILVTDAGLIYFRKFKHIFMVGMSEEVFPEVIGEGMFLGPRVIDAISRSTSQLRSSSDTRNSIEGHTFDLALSSSGQITFSYVYSNEEGRRLLPSGFVLQKIEKVTGKEDLISRIEKESLSFSSFYPDMGTVWTASETDRLRAGVISEGAVPEGLLESAPGQFVREFDSVLERKQLADSDPLEWTFRDGDIGNLVKGRTLSATDLTEYSKCPFRYVATRILSANQILPPLNPMDRGSQMHEILRRFYSSHSLAFIRSAEREEMRREMEKCADDYFSELYGGMERMRLIFNIHVAEVKESLAAFMEREIISEGRMKGEIAGLEERFGYNGQKEFRIGPHRFRGVIDRVETTGSEGGGLVVYDYKSGNPESLTKRYFRAGEKLLDFGIPLYSLYLTDVEGKRLAGAFYYMLLKSDGVPDRAGIVNRNEIGALFPIPERRRSYFSVKDEDSFMAELTRYREEIVSVADRIRACDFAVQPKEGECTYCNYFSVCRYGGQRA